jgi:hypothetical protein
MIRSDNCNTQRQLRRLLTTCEPGEPASRRCTFMGDTSCTGTSSTAAREADA